MRRTIFQPMSYALILVALVVGPLIPAPEPAAAVAVLDYEIPGGRFYTQANGYPAGASPKGFSVVDTSNVKLFSEYARLGGSTDLGPPISRRFELNGAPAQAMKKAILVWRMNDGVASALPVMDLLHEAGKNDWLLKTHGIPRPVELPAVERVEMLRANAAFFNFYTSLDEPLIVLGLPTSRIEETAAGLVMRFQRGAIYQSKAEGELSLVDVGAIAREAGLLGKAIFLPESPPLNAPDWSGYSMKGKATWYGADFHGKPMANGVPFNMHDPTTTACNAYPLGTRLKVTARNGASVEVRVTDTGGFKYPYVVDLSQAAFKLLADPGEHMIDVTVEVISTP